MVAQLSLFGNGPADILESVCRAHGVTLADLLSKRRRGGITAARWAVARRLRSDGMSYPKIGAVLGLDHSSVRYACSRNG